MSSSTFARSAPLEASAPPHGAAASQPGANAAGLRVGYLPLGAAAGSEAEGALRRAGCSVIRRERARDGQVLAALVAFLDRGDLLVAPDVPGLPCGYGGLARLLCELDARGASAVFLAEDLSTDGEAGRQLRNAVRAAAELRPAAAPARPTAATRARAEAMAAAGARPREIVRALRISRMTLWRWLKAADAADPGD